VMKMRRVTLITGVTALRIILSVILVHFKSYLLFKNKYK